jgi:hypothetical protein
MCGTGSTRSGSARAPRDPPVQELAVVVDEVESSVRHLMPAEVTEHREQKAGEEQRRPRPEAAPGPDERAKAHSVSDCGELRA